MPGGLGGRGQCLLGYHVPSHLAVGLEAACDHPFPTSFWKRLSRLMSKVNPEPNVIHVMGCYVLGNPNGEKVQHPASLQTPFPSQPSHRDPRAWPHQLGLLAPHPRFSPPLSCSALHSESTPSFQLFQNLRTLMTPYRVIFESPLELSAQGERWAGRPGRGVPAGEAGRGAGRGVPEAGLSPPSPLPPQGSR